jgi:hypothetical protein
MLMVTIVMDKHFAWSSLLTFLSSCILGDSLMLFEVILGGAVFSTSFDYVFKAYVYSVLIQCSDFACMDHCGILQLGWN